MSELSVRSAVVVDAAERDQLSAKVKALNEAALRKDNLIKVCLYTFHLQSTTDLMPFHSNPTMHRPKLSLSIVICVSIAHCGSLSLSSSSLHVSLYLASGS